LDAAHGGVCFESAKPKYEGTNHLSLRCSEPLKRRLLRSVTSTDHNFIFVVVNATRVDGNQLIASWLPSSIAMRSRHSYTLVVRHVRRRNVAADRSLSNINTRYGGDMQIHRCRVAGHLSETGWHDLCRRRTVSPRQSICFFVVTRACPLLVIGRTADNVMSNRTDIGIHN